MGVHSRRVALLSLAAAGTLSYLALPNAMLLAQPVDAPLVGPGVPDAAVLAEVEALGPRSAAAAERNKNYAPWDPVADMAALREKYGLVGPGPQSPIPTARFPGYLRVPTSLEDLMPPARAAVRQTGGRVPLGLVERGDVAVLVVPYTADLMVQEAIVAAFDERGVEARVLWENELAGFSKEDLAAVDQAQNVFRAGDGQQELNYISSTGYIPDWDAAREWFKKQDPVLYHATWPDLKLSNPQQIEISENYRDSVSEALIKYLDEHPEVNKVFFRTGGRPFAQRDLKHHGGKMTGNYTYLNHYDIMSDVPSYPSDVWRMIEAKMIEPLEFIDRVEATDPEGTAFALGLTADQAKGWARGAYLQGHLYMVPSQAAGIWPYSVVDYPAQENTWLPPVLVTDFNGQVASSNSHASNHPRMEIHIKDGYVSDVMGGGLYGDGFRLFMQYPGINDLQWPFQDQKGYFWFFEGGTGTNPKYFKHPQEQLEGSNSSERNAGGVIHWSFGAEVKMGPEPEKDKALYSPDTLAFAEEHNVPPGHSMHNHNLLPTYQVRLRDSNEWVTIIEHGQIQANNDPEVRALAARYGDPDQILRRDWIPEIPGITVEGNYDTDYSAKVGEHWTNWANSINDSSNPYIQ